MNQIEQLKFSQEPDHVKRKRILELIKDFPNPQKLEALYNFYDQLPIQGSEEWRQNRKVGASNIAAVLNICAFNTAYDVAMRMFRDNHTKYLATCWGNIFEPVAKVYLSKFIKIYEFGSIPGFGEPIVTSCSPDGVFIMTQEFINELTTNYIIKVNDIYLLEIKCPFSRYPKDIPRYYVPQLQMGMATLDITTGSAFCEFVIRACSMENFNFNSECTNYYGQRPIEHMEPYYLGYVLVRTPYFESSFDDNKIIHAPEPNMKNSYISYVDYGKADLSHIVHSDNDFVYSRIWDKDYENVMSEIHDTFNPNMFSEKTCLNTFSEKTCLNTFSEKKGDFIYGIIPYKIFDIRLRAVKRENFQPVIESVVKFVNDIKAIGYVPDKIKEYCDNWHPEYNEVKIYH